MAVNKVEYGNETLIDLTDDTVYEDVLLYGATAHAADGEVITGRVDLQNYYTKHETDALIPDMSVYATQQYVNQQVSGIDLSGYATKDNLNGLATEQYVNQQVAGIDLSGYAKKSDIPSTSGLASTSYVDTEINEVMNVANGKTASYVFDTVSALDTWLANSANTAKLRVGDVFLIKALNVPDYWWDGSAKAILETTKVPLENYALKSELPVKASAGYNGYIFTGGDGVAEMGKYIDFHATANHTGDFSTRLTCIGNGNSLNIPSGSGTLTYGDKQYKIVVASSAPTTTDTSVITFVV